VASFTDFLPLCYKVSGGEHDRRLMYVRPLFDVLGGWTLVLAESFV